MSANAPFGGRRPNLAVFGAAGMVGESILDVLATREDPWGDIHLFDLYYAAGGSAKVRGVDQPVRTLSPEAIGPDIDLVLCDLPEDHAQFWVPYMTERGAIVVDNSGAFRADPDVPLVAPELNPAQVRNRPRNIVSSPGSLALIGLSAMTPLHQRWGISGVYATALISASGAGQFGVQRLIDEVDAVAGKGGELGRRAGDVRFAISDELDPTHTPFAAPLAYNVVPWAGYLEDDGWSSEENKFIREVRRLLGVPRLRVSATCVRVPVLNGHSLSLHLHFETEMDVERAREVLIQAPGVVLMDDLDTFDFPTPVDVVGMDPSFAGRLRQPEGQHKCLDLFVTGDNLRRGAASNCVVLAELIAGFTPVPDLID